MHSTIIIVIRDKFKDAQSAQVALYTSTRDETNFCSDYI